MTDTARKEVEELTEFLGTVFNPAGEYTYPRYVASRLIHEGYTKRPQDNNALVPLDGIALANFIHKVELLDYSRSKSNPRKWNVTSKQALMISKEICAKLGKDNNQCETIAGSSFKFLSNKEEDIYTFEDGKPIGKDNNEFGHSGDITVSSYPEDNQQPPKERKVSLEEIKEAILIEFTLPSNKSVVSWLDRSALAILSLLNATEERKGKV